MIYVNQAIRLLPLISLLANIAYSIIQGRFMRWMRFTLPLLLLISPLAFGQKQYTEGACLLLQHQMVQFAAQPNSHNYQSAKREVDNHCQNPIPAPVKDLVLSNVPAKTITVGKSIESLLFRKLHKTNKLRVNFVVK